VHLVGFIVRKKGNCKWSDNFQDIIYPPITHQFIKTICIYFTNHQF